MYSDSVLRRRRACRSGATIPARAQFTFGEALCLSRVVGALPEQVAGCAASGRAELIRPVRSPDRLIYAGIERELRGSIARPVLSHRRPA